MDKKTIAILTLPLHYNYGGILQAYALQKVVRNNGFVPLSLKLEYDVWYPSFERKFKDAVCRFVEKCLGRPSTRLTIQEREYVGQNTLAFVDKYINETRPFRNVNQIKKILESRSIGKFIVGSDQVWRPEYVGDIRNYFFDFLDSDDSTRIISYAASFGGSVLSIEHAIIDQCKNAIKKFTAVSVRETDGIKLCKNHLDVDAVQVLDPTMLLDRHDYVALMNDDQRTIKPSSQNRLFYYVLDNTPNMQNALQIVSSKLNCNVYKCMPERNATPDLIRNKEQSCVYPPVEEWIANFYKADYVLTDSFHGCAFSIIFNKPFWVIGNIERGLSRFQSLLSLFGLEDRLITIDNLPDLSFDQYINWDLVNAKKRDLQEKSFDFLRNNIL